MDIYKHGTQLVIVGALRQALFTSWRNIPDNLEQTLVSGSAQQVFEVIKRIVEVLTIECSFFHHLLLVLNFVKQCVYIYIYIRIYIYTHFFFVRNKYPLADRLC